MPSYSKNACILGNDDAQNMEDFFSRVFEQAAQYKKNHPGQRLLIAVITRRCHVLLQAFFEKQVITSSEALPLHLKNKDRAIWSELYNKNVVTDDALWAMAADLYRYEGEEICFTHLIVIDELLYHGRAMNHFLYGLEARLRLAAGVEKADAVVNAFLRQLEICVFARRNTGSLLLDRYRRILNAWEKSDTATPSEKDTEKWHDLSLKYAQYVSILNINNVAFSWSFRLPLEYDWATKADNNRDMAGSFVSVHTQLQDRDQDSYFYLYPNEDAPRAICTVRRKESDCSDSAEKALYVPFIMLDHVKLPRLQALHAQLLHDAQQDQKEYLFSFLQRYDGRIGNLPPENKPLYLEWLSETSDLVLCSLLMKRFLKEFKAVLVPSDISEYIDWGQLTRNYVCFSECSNVSDACPTQDALRELWTWDLPAERLESYLEIYTADASPIDVSWLDTNRDFSSHICNQSSSVVQCVEDSIAQIAFEAERAAEIRYRGGIDLTDGSLATWGDMHSIDTLLCVCKQLQPYYDDKFGLFQVLGVILQALDLGELGMNTTYSRHPRDSEADYWAEKEEIYTRQRAGEAALFIWPSRYKNFIPALEDVQNYWGNDLDGAAYDIKRFSSRVVKQADLDSQQRIKIASDVTVKAETLDQQLIRFYNAVSLSGQKFSDWNCDLYDRRKPVRVQWENREKDARFTREFTRVYRA